jgi:acyl carrier protein
MKEEISPSSPTKIPLHFHSIMTRDDITGKILAILTEDFEFETPGPDDNLRDDHGFDSIDAIELLGKIELTILGFSLSREEKEKAMSIRTINDIVNYIEDIKQSRNT